MTEQMLQWFVLGFTAWPVAYLIGFAAAHTVALFFGPPGKREDD
ncbi:MAG: hypothetical protein V3V34_11880 [Kiloniellales bacterium]